MKAAAIILGSCALLAVPLTPASAGPCTAEIDNVSKALSGQATGSNASPRMQDYQANLSIGGGQATSASSDDATVPAGQSRETTGSSMPMPSADPKPDRAASGTELQAGAKNSLEQARLFDQQGKETDCLRAVGMAKLISGFR